MCAGRDKKERNKLRKTGEEGRRTKKKQRKKKNNEKEKE
jgi:hypothetical protein